MIKTFFDFCSGVGGGRLGLEKCGLQSVGRSDTSRLADTTYRGMHNTVNDKNLGNLKKLNKENLPQFDVMIAGFPCQTFSVIGRRQGFSDDRGQIIFHLARILDECKPSAFILENVRGLVSHDKGKTLNIILNLLKSSGYDVIYKVITSLDHGVPQMRQRVYFIGVRKDFNININKFEWPEAEPVPHLKKYLVEEDNHIKEEELIRFKKYLQNDINIGKFNIEDFLKEEYLIIDTRMSDLRLYRGRVPTLRSHRDGIYYVKKGTLRELTGHEALLLQGFPKKMVKKVKDSVSNRHLLMQAGNAMTVNVIEKLGKSLVLLFNGDLKEEYSE